VAAACLYALNSYMVGYSWNVMWLDSIMIFPIIMMGIEILIEEEDGRLYCLALFYALYSSIPIKSHKTPTNNKNHPKFMINCTFQSPKRLHKLQ
jgi:hypothetical protein